MPTYSNAVAQTSQATTVASNNLVISYANIALISTIPHKYQVEVERIFTTDRNGSSSNVTSFLSDAGVSIEAKRNVFIIPETHPSSGIALWTINETNKTITINNTNLATYTFTNASPAYSVPVPNVIDGQVVTIRRKTISNTPLVTWTAGNQLTSNQLNLETTQLLYLLQEVLDRVFRQVSIGGDIVSQIADNSVTTSKIVNSNITTIKIADQAVDQDKIKDLNVINSKLGALSVTNDKIANSTITAGKLSPSSQAWTLVGTLALTDLATSATGDKVTNKNYVIDRVSKLGVITKDSSNITTTQPLIGTTTTSEANDDVSLQSGGLWFNPIDGGLRVRVKDTWVRVTGTPLTINDYISTGATAQTKTGNLTLSGDFIVDTNTLFVNSTTDRVGIGTLIPSQKLHVNNGTIRIDNTDANGTSFISAGTGASGSNLQITHNKTGVVSLLNSGGGFTFDTFSGEQVRITNDGNVGIGTSTIYAKLEINEGSSADPTPGIRLKTPGGGTDIHAALSSGNYNPLVQANDRGIIYKGTDADVGTGSFVIAPWSTTASGLKLNSSGNVGIGKSPTATLDVSGSAAISGNLTLGTATMSTPSGSAPIFGCRAWVNFDGTQNGTITPRGSGNIASVVKTTDQGRYTITFTTEMPSANYSVVGLTGNTSLLGAYSATVFVSSQSTTGFSFYTGTHSANSTATYVNMNWVNLAIFC